MTNATAIPRDNQNQNPHNNKQQQTKTTTRKCALPSKCIQPTSSHASPSLSHVYHHHHDDHDQHKKCSLHSSDALVYPNFLSFQEAAALESDISLRMKRKRLEKGHWDAVISNYKEVELSSSWSSSSSSSGGGLSSLTVQTIDRVRNHLEQTHFTCKRGNECCINGSSGGISAGSVDDLNNTSSSRNPHHVKWLNCHAIYLSRDGVLSAHVDSVKFSGDIVAGVSLKSACIMRLKPVMVSAPAEGGGGGGGGGQGGEEEGGFVDLYLPPRSLYVLSGDGRYTYTHEILPSGSSFQLNGGSGTNNADDELIQVYREDRLSVIFRDAL